MTEELKPCPFCGGEGKVGKSIHCPSVVGDIQCFIHCQKCDLETGLFNDKEAPVVYWNERVKEN